MDVEKFQEVPVKTVGDDVSKPFQHYEELNLPEPIAANVLTTYKVPTLVQKYTIPIILEGRDLFVCSATGSGTTAAYLLPLITKLSREEQIPSSPSSTNAASPKCLILAPIRAVAYKILAKARQWGDLVNLKACATCGGESFDAQFKELSEGCDILISTPGRLVGLINRGYVSLSKVKYFCLDGADTLLDLGFEPDIRVIAEQKDMPAVGFRQTVLFSATLPKQVQRLAQDLLTDLIFVHVGAVATSSPITQKVLHVNDNKHTALVDALNGVNGPTAVFVLMRKTVKEVDEFLSGTMGLPSISIRSDQSQADRSAALAKFESGERSIIVCTDVTARGLPISRLAHVINYDMPLTIDDYKHRIGRARGDKSGVATTFFTKNDKHLAKDLIAVLEASQQEVPEWLREYAPNRAADNDSTHSRTYGGRGRGSRGRGYGSSAPVRGGRGANHKEQHDGQNNNQNDTSASSNDNGSSSGSDINNKSKPDSNWW